MFEGAAVLFIVPELAALGRLTRAAFAVFGGFAILVPGFDAMLGRLAGMLFTAFDRFAVARLFTAFDRFAAARLLPAFGRLAGFALAMDAPGLWLALFGRAP